jgi:broad specificity phosphatase PhoE
MSTTFVLLRHGLATHNIGSETYCDPAHADASLTGEGIQQAYNLREAGLAAECDLVACSPLRRCRQTLRFGVPGADLLPVLLDDRLMEPQGAAICNRRAERRELSMEIPARWSLEGVAVANPWDTATEGINVHGENAEFDARVREFTEEVLARGVRRVLIVTHHDWIRAWCRIYHGEMDVSVGNCEWIVRAV